MTGHTPAASQSLERSLTATPPRSTYVAKVPAVPASPCLSASGSELSFASDTESTDFIETPPISPRRAVAERKSSMDAAMHADLRQLPTSSGRPSSPSPAFANMLAGLHLQIKSPPSSSTLPVRGLFGHAQIEGNAPATWSASSGAYPPTPPRARPPLPQSMSAKRSRPTPGTIDLSGLSPFPLRGSSSSVTPLATLSGSTPRAGSDRPALLSRWSSDSEESDEQAESSSTSPESELREASHASGSPSPPNSKPVLFLDPFSANSPSDAIPSPVPVRASSQFALPPAPRPHQDAFSPWAEQASSSSPPPAPKPHQQGFSPFSEEFAPSNSISSSYFLRRRTLSSDGGNSAGSSPGSPLPPPNPSKPLTRSQGLRILDAGSKARARLNSRSLSQQLAEISVQAGSSTTKAAEALLSGTISPAATTTDPLRVKLREIPGAITPDGGPPSLRPVFNRSLSVSAQSPRSPLSKSSLPFADEESRPSQRLNQENPYFAGYV